MRKTATLIVIAVLVLSSLVMAGSAFAESIPKPSVPEFAVALVDSSYDVPTTYSIDPYTGENVTHEGYHVESKTIEVKIKNQPLASDWIISYNVRVKGHYEDDWHELYYASIDGYPTCQFSGVGSEYTVFSYEGEYSSTGELEVERVGTFPVDAEVDFQVEAMIGECVRQVGSGIYAPWVFSGEVSGWSETQTLTISEFQTPSPEATSTPEPTPSPYTEPLSTEQGLILGVFAVVAVFAFGLVLLYRTKRK
jgi:hypothetical protein